MLVAAGLLLAACGGGSSDDATAGTGSSHSEIEADTQVDPGAGTADTEDAADMADSTDSTDADTGDGSAEESDPNAASTEAEQTDAAGGADAGTGPATKSADAAAADEASSDDASARPEPGSFEVVDSFVTGVIEKAELEGAGLIIVDRDEGVVHHQHYGTFTEDRISMIASSSKMISAGVLLRLDDEGVLDLDAPLTDVVDWAGDHPDLTAAHLISNSSGLVGLLPDVLYPHYICQWVPTETIQGCGETVLTTAGDDDHVVAPDTEFRYGGAQWQVAGAVAEVAAGESWAKLIDEIYIEPCGVDSLGYLSLGQVTAIDGYPTDFGGDPDLHGPSENPNIEGGAYITTGDYGELLLMHLRGGECDGVQVLSQDALDRMHTDRIGPIYGGFDFGDGDGGYGMGWWIEPDTGIITDGGAWGALAWLNLDEGYGGYWIIEDQNATTTAIRDDLLSLVHWELTGEELPAG